ncbi:hypothetical protein QR680_018775 [Steinernema hermaphroditum]|uniref:Uncharacterized protein n=1 Tax=Steinernema hermaphroditum TaxID=289476 RepID=A0AA39LR93_9BILA|nr:hypothetical protein QR680_018775 [Steinernema hermaphroditum]
MLDSRFFLSNPDFGLEPPINYRYRNLTYAFSGFLLIMLVIFLCFLTCCCCRLRSVEKRIRERNVEAGWTPYDFDHRIFGRYNQDMKRSSTFNSRFHNETI